MSAVKSPTGFAVTSNYTDAQKTVLTITAEGLPLRMAAQEAGINAVMVERWERLYPDFAADMARARALGNRRWVTILIQHAETNWQVALKLATAFDRETWGDTTKITIDFSSISISQLDAICAGERVKYLGSDIPALDDGSGNDGSGTATN